MISEAPLQNNSVLPVFEFYIITLILFLFESNSIIFT